MSLKETIALPDGKTYEQPLGLFINNEFVAAKSGEFLETFNPSTGESICKVHAAGAEDVDIAVRAAVKAFPGWKKMSGSNRRDLFFKLASLLQEKRDIFGSVETFDSGKPKQCNALPDIDETIELMKYLGGWCDKLEGKYIPVDDKKFAYTVHEPIGVVGCIIPFNYPLSMFAWKLTSLAAGNCAVFKTADQTPLSVLYLANLFVEAGFPPGVLSILSGTGAVAGNAIVVHPDVHKIAFTGSTATGALIQKQAATHLKKLTLECGGKSPLIVFKEADLEQAIKWGAAGIFSNMGQICSGSSRMYIHESIYEEFLAGLKKHVVEEYIQGCPYEEKTIVGPQITKVQKDKILAYLKSGKEQGARIVLGGGEPTTLDAKLSKGYFVEPTIFADVTPDMKIVREEIFGPVVACAKFSTEEEVIKLANDTPYGLGACVFSQDISQAHRVANEIEAGMVWINSNNDCSVSVPFGGTKMSGYGRELGAYGLAEFTQAKAVHVNLGHKL